MVCPCSFLPGGYVLLLLMVVMSAGEACLQLSTRHRNIYGKVVAAHPTRRLNHGLSKINCLIDFCNLTLAHPQLGENTLNALRSRLEMETCNDNCTANTTGAVCQHPTISLYQLRRGDGLSCGREWEWSFLNLDTTKESLTSIDPSPATFRTSLPSQPSALPSTTMKPHTASYYSFLNTSLLRIRESLGDDGALIIVPGKTPHLYVITKDRITKYKGSEAHNFNGKIGPIHLSDTLRILLNVIRTSIQLKPDLNINQNPPVEKKVEGPLVNKPNRQVKKEVNDPSITKPLKHYFSKPPNHSTPDGNQIKPNISSNQESKVEKQVDDPTPPKRSKPLKVANSYNDRLLRDGTAGRNHAQLGDDKRMRQYPQVRGADPRETSTEEEIEVDDIPSLGEVERGTSGRLEREGAGGNDDGARILMNFEELKQRNDSLNVSGAGKGKELGQKDGLSPEILKKKASGLKRVKIPRNQKELKEQIDSLNVSEGEVIRGKEFGQKGSLSKNVYIKGDSRNGGQTSRHDELTVKKTDYLPRNTDSRTVKRKTLQVEKKNEDLSIMGREYIRRNGGGSLQLMEHRDSVSRIADLETTTRNDAEVQKESEGLSILGRKGPGQIGVGGLEVMEHSDSLSRNTDLKTVKRKDLQVQKENEGLLTLERKDTGQNGVQNLLMGESDSLSRNTDLKTVKRKHLQVQKEIKSLSIMEREDTGQIGVQELLIGESDSLLSNKKSGTVKKNGLELHKKDSSGVKVSLSHRTDTWFGQKHKFDQEQKSRHTNKIPLQNIFTTILNTRSSSSESMLTVVVVVVVALLTVVVLMAVCSCLITLYYVSLSHLRTRSYSLK